MNLHVNLSVNRSKLSKTYTRLLAQMINRKRKSNLGSYPNKKLAAILLILFGGAVLSPGVLAAKSTHHDKTSLQDCHYPKVLIDVETLQGATKTLCVNTQMADWLLPHTSSYYAPPPDVHDTQVDEHNDDIRKICPLPKELINIETPGGEIKTLCVKAKVANKLLSNALVTQPPLPAAVGSRLIATSLARLLMQGVVTGVTSGATGGAVGWALGALGFTDGSSETDEILGEMSAQLEAIGETLAALTEEAKNINDSIRIQTCSSFIDSTKDARNLIDGLGSDYQDFVITAGVAGFIPPMTNCSIAGTGICVEDWAAAVLDNSSQGTGIINAVFDIHNSMIALSSSDGIIASCLNAAVLPLPVAGEDDSNYYDSVSSLMDAFYNYQAQALLLLVEANNFNAWVAAGEPGGDPVSDPTITSDLCTDPPNGAVAVSCQKTISSLNTVHNNLVRQFTMAGVRYSDEDVRIHYRDDPAPPLLFVRSLEDFTNEAYLQDKGMRCWGHLQSNNTCGITVGTQQDGLVPFGITYEYQDAWRPVFAGEFGSLLRYAGNQTPASFLEDAGFHNPQFKLITHGNTFQNFLYLPGTSLVLQTTTTCFTDLDLPPSFAVQPVCNDQRLRPFWTTDGFFTLVENPNIPTLEARGGFYYFTASQSPLVFTDLPGWDPATQSRAKGRQYQWPVLTMDEISCTKGRSLTNVAGAYTRCGDDLDVWLAQHVPGPTVNNGRQPTYHYIGQQPWTDTIPGWVDETGTQLTDGLLPPVNEGELDDRWVVFREVGIPQPSVAFDLGDKTDVGLISVTYYDHSGATLGPDWVEIFVSNDGGLTYPTDPVAVYTDFKRDSQDPNVATHTDFIPVSIKGADTIRMDFYQGDKTPDTGTILVLLAEVSFFE